MRSSSRSSRAVALPLALLLAVGTLPLDIAPAEAGSIKFRYRSHAAKRVHKNEDVREHGRRPIRLRLGRGSSSSASSAENKDEKVRPRPAGAAAAHAARAQAALAAEQTQVSKASPVYEALPVGKTTEYSGGVTCIAGC
jgi:hypothetical protein